MRFIAIFVILLVATLPAHAARCKTEREVQTDAALGFFAYRIMAVDPCQSRLGMMGMAALRKRMQAKCMMQLDEAGTIRLLYFRRRDADQWRKNLLVVYRAFAVLRMSPGEAGVLFNRGMSRASWRKSPPDGARVQGSGGGLTPISTSPPGLNTKRRGRLLSVIHC